MMRILLALVLLFPLLSSGPAGFSQELSRSASEVNWRVERESLDREFAARLQEIAQWCRENDLEQQVPETFKIFVARDLQRQYIFPPSEKSMPTPPEGIHGKWLEQINESKRWQAERIFELAKRAAADGAGGPAFQMIHEVLFFDRDHPQAREILGHRKTDEGWRVAPDRIKSRLATKANDMVRWPAKTYLLVTSPHFEIESNATEERTIRLAENLERWHAVWRQVYFDYWSSAEVLQRWIDGKSSYRHSRRKFRVIFFADKPSYVQNLAQFVRGVEASSGYYSPDERVSFFYDSHLDPATEDTWRHELNHQLFRESIKTSSAPFEEGYIWLDEGIATYFESLTDYESYVTLGGFDARRIQYAKIRLFLEGFYIPLNELAGIGRSDLQNHPDMARLYSQVAGLSDMLMNDRNGALEPNLIEFLKLLYSGPSRRLKPGTFEELMGISYADLDQRYADYLATENNRVVRHLTSPEIRTEFSVARSDLREEGFQSLGRCINATWLDLSRNAISPARLGHLKKCQSVSQLFMTECQIAPGSLKALSAFSNLEEVDLSGSTVVDQQLVELQGNSSIRSLRLVATRVTDRGILQLTGIPNLKALDLSRSTVTENGIAELKKRMPGVDVRF